jgi:pilus assembly protein CpaC
MSKKLIEQGSNVLNSTQRARLIAGVLGLALMLPAIADAASLSPNRGRSLAASGRGSMSVSMGNTESMRTGASYVDLVVGDPDIADAMPLTDRSFYVHGKKLGTTTISAYDAQKNLVGEVEVEVGYNTSRLRQEIRRRLPGSNVEVSTVNGRIMLGGSVTDGVALDRAMTIAKQFGAEPINSMSITQSQQVMLEVRFIEVSRNATKAFGLQWNLNGKSGSAFAGPALAATGSAPFASVLGHILSGGTTADVLVQALEDKGLARRLAEPNLVAMSGQTASFLAGGEYPFPVAGNLGQISIEFKKFGVGLGFTPLVLANGVISLKIEPEVSQIDTSTTVQTPAGPVPSLVVRRASTQVELRDGQSFAIAGLMQSSTQDHADQLPWLGDVPIIGSLFKSTGFIRNETELAIIVTPRLVQPTRPGQRLKSPMDSTVVANDLDRFLGGKMELSKREAAFADARPTETTQGHILDMRNGGNRGR